MASKIENIFLSSKSKQMKKKTAAKKNPKFFLYSQISGKTNTHMRCRGRRYRVEKVVKIFFQIKNKFLPQRRERTANCPACRCVRWWDIFSSHCWLHTTRPIFLFSISSA